MADPVGLPLPEVLCDLIAEGFWRRERLTGERVRRLLPEEPLLDLRAPPFVTIAQEAAKAANDFWQAFGAPQELDFDCALIIAECEIGADTVLVLDYAADPSNPPVKYLSWEKSGNHWRVVAEDMSSLARTLGLVGE